MKNKRRAKKTTIIIEVPLFTFHVNEGQIFSRIFPVLVQMAEELQLGHVPAPRVVAGGGSGVQENLRCHHAHVHTGAHAQRL